jgi:hypothetical protein
MGPGRFGILLRLVVHLDLGRVRPQPLDALGEVFRLFTVLVGA